MENFDNQIFGFGTNDNNNLEQTSNFNYNSISGLGESDYENEDLFSIDESQPETQTNDITGDNTINSGYDFNGFNYRIGGEENNKPAQNSFENPFVMEQSQDIFFNPVSELPIEQTIVEPQFQAQIEPEKEQTFNTEPEITGYVEPQTSLVQENVIQPVETIVPFDNTLTNEALADNTQPDFISVIENLKPVEQEPEIELQSNETKIDNIEEYAVEPQPIEENVVPVAPPTDYDTFNLGVSEEQVNDTEDITLESKPEEELEAQLESSDYNTSVLGNENLYETQESQMNLEDEEDIVISDTPIEELKKLTKYEDEYVESTDIASLFDKVSVNVQGASEIFRKNSDMKAKIDTRFDELKKLQSEVESSKQKQIDEVNKYKEEVLEKLTEKKEEIEKRLNTLKEYQANLEKEKLEFEKYKKAEQANIDKVQKEVQAAYDDRREELSAIEDALRKQKDELDQERSQLSLDRIQYEADKNELANNLLKFNELVNSFTDGVNSAGRE
ncbi:MAG: hypothetical protein IJY25_06080 [Bacilli bacterium]|nr:hypothetical protein [Bacilli bacterium]